MADGNKPEISVIVNCFNEAGLLRETLDSVFAQTFRDWEIVFWDNASDDGSGDIATSYGDKVRYFRSETTVPLGHARKLAYEQTRGKYVALLDADDLWLPEKLERQMNLFKSDPSLGMTFCDSSYLFRNRERFSMFKHSQPHRGGAFGHLLAKNFVGTSTIMFRREALDRLDYVFNEKYSMVADYDLSLRVAYNYPIDYVDEPLLKWRMRDWSVKPWRKSLPPLGAEMNLVIEDLVDRYPDIEANYSSEIESFRKLVDYDLAVSAWRNGNPAEARQYLRRNLTNKKSAIIFLCTFLMSYDQLEKLKWLYWKLGTPRI